MKQRLVDKNSNRINSVKFNSGLLIVMRESRWKLISRCWLVPHLKETKKKIINYKSLHRKAAFKVSPKRKLSGKKLIA